MMLHVSCVALTQQKAAKAITDFQIWNFESVEVAVFPADMQLEWWGAGMHKVIIWHVLILAIKW